MINQANVTLREKLSYLLTTYGYSAIASIVSSFILYYYTDIVLLSPAVVSGLLFGVRLIDGGIDPLIGHYMDHHQTRYGKYRGYLIYWAVPFCLASVLLFLPVKAFGMTGTIICCTVIYLIWSFLYSIIESANLSLLSVITGDAGERYGVNSAKIMGGILATLAARFIALNLVERFGGGNEAKGYLLTVLLFAVTGLLCILLPVRSITERNEKPIKPLPLPATLFVLLKNKKILFMLLFFFAHQMASSVKGQASLYYMKYIVNQPELTSLFLTTSVVSSLAMQPVIMICARKIPVRILIPAGYLGGALGMAMMGMAETSVPMLFAGNFLYGITVAFPANLLYIYVAQLSDQQVNSGSATVHAMLALAARFATAIGGSVISGILSVSHYMPNMIQTAESQSGIKFTFVVLTFILYLVAAVFAVVSFSYNIRKGESA